MTGKSKVLPGFCRTECGGCSDGVRPKPDFGIGKQNQDQISISKPKLFLPKAKLPPYSFPQIHSHTQLS